MGASWCNSPPSADGHLDKALRLPLPLLRDPRNPQDREEASSAVSRRSLSGDFRVWSEVKWENGCPPPLPLPTALTSWPEAGEEDTAAEM